MNTPPHDENSNEPASTNELSSKPDLVDDAEQSQPTTNAIEAWKQTIQVQEHFNDIQLKLRSVMVTLLIASIGAAGYAINKGAYFSIGGFSIAASVIAAFAAVVSTLAFYLMDFGYHMLLKGAVDHGKTIEEIHKAAFPEIALSTKISDSSTHKVLWFEADSTYRLHAMYRCVIVVCVLIGIFGQVATKTPTQSTNAAVKDCPVGDCSKQPSHPACTPAKSLEQP